MHAAIAADRDPTACDRHDMLKQAIKVVASKGVPSKWLVSTGFSDVDARAVQLLPMFETCFKLEGPTMQRGSSKWLDYMMTKFGHHVVKPLAGSSMSVKNVSFGTWLSIPNC